MPLSLDHSRRPLRLGHIRQLIEREAQLVVVPELIEQDERIILGVSKERTCFIQMNQAQVAFQGVALPDFC